MRERLAAWHARRCLDRCWLIPAHTTARVVFDSLAERLDDGFRLIVCELGADALWFNLSPDARDTAHLAGHQRRADAR